MKYLYYLILVLFITSCNNIENSEKSLVDNFIQKIVLNERYTTKELFKFIEISEKTNRKLSKEDMNKYLQMINFIISGIKDDLKEHNFKYTILSNKEIKEHKISHRIRYNGSSNIYYLVVESKDVIRFFIIKDKKIISFFPGLVKHENSPSYPVIL